MGTVIIRAMLACSRSRQVPFVAGGNAGPSFSIYRTVQPQLAHPEAYGFSPPKPSVGKTLPLSSSSSSSSATFDTAGKGREEEKEASYAAARESLGSKGRSAARTAIVGAESLKQNGSLSEATASAVRSALGPLSSCQSDGESTCSKVMSVCIYQCQKAI